MTSHHRSAGWPRPTRKIALAIAGMISCVAPLATAQRDGGGVPRPPVLALSFEGHGIGPVGEPGLRDMWPDVESVILSDRIQIVNQVDGGRALRVAYPKGGVGPRQSGGAFILKIPPAPEYYLSYRVRFHEGFEWKKGGKLPGLSSGGGKYSGGRIPTEGDGWSARVVWGRGGYAGVYLYHVDTPGPWGTSIPLSGTFVPGTWHTVVQHVRLNTHDLANGILQVWVDNKLRLDRHNVRFRLGEKGNIDSLCFSTFFGGHTPDFAPTTDTAALFDDFVIEEQRPQGM